MVTPTCRRHSWSRTLLTKYMSLAYMSLAIETPRDKPMAEIFRYNVVGETPDLSSLNHGIFQHRGRLLGPRPPLQL